MSPRAERNWSGTESQIEWAEKILPRVCEEFDRVLKALEGVATRQTALDRQDTRAMIDILQEKRAEVLKHTEAGYFIKNWQELNDQVRKLLREDHRYEAIRLARVIPSEKLQTIVLGRMEKPCSGY